MFCSSKTDWSVDFFSGRCSCAIKVSAKTVKVKEGTTIVNILFSIFPPSHEPEGRGGKESEGDLSGKLAVTLENIYCQQGQTVWSQPPLDSHGGSKSTVRLCYWNMWPMIICFAQQDPQQKPPTAQDAETVLDWKRKMSRWYIVEKKKIIVDIHFIETTIRKSSKVFLNSND